MLKAKLEIVANELKLNEKLKLRQHHQYELFCFFKTEDKLSALFEYYLNCTEVSLSKQMEFLNLRWSNYKITRNYFVI